MWMISVKLATYLNKGYCMPCLEGEVGHVYANFLGIKVDDNGLISDVSIL